MTWPKPEYGDLHRWRVSAGVALMVAAVALPWLFLRESSDLLIAEAQVEELTGFAQWAVKVRQVVSIVVAVAALALSPWMFIYGFKMLRDGLAGWGPVQARLDEKIDLENQRLKAGLPPPSVEEKAQSVEREAEDALEPAVGLSWRQLFIEAATRVMATEHQVGAKLQRALSATHELLQDRRIDGTPYDFVALSRVSEEPSYLIEVRLTHLPKATEKVEQLLRVYAEGARSFVQTSGRPVTLALLFVTKARGGFEVQSSSLRAAFREARQIHGDIVVHFFHEVGFDAVRTEDVHTLLQGRGVIQFHLDD